MNKKSILVLIVSVMMAVIMAAMPPVQVAAEQVQETGDYISEIKIGVGKTANEAANSLDGYTILTNDDGNVDLNEDAGGGIGSKGNRVVYLGYKTTNDRSKAITDLAVMNMKGGYSVKDYELLMEQYMTEEVIPFVDSFLVGIKEYRENYASDNADNKARADYVHDALNKLTDDDCDNKGLGDLFLNETKYEMGDEAYNALSEEEKKNHADIVTIISQANGKATLIMVNLITRAADPEEDTWIDRFVTTTYDDLLALYPDMLPSDAEAELAKEFDDDAHEILSMWGALKDELDSYDTNMARLEELRNNDLSEIQKIIEEYDASTATDEQTEEYVQALARFTAVTDEMTALLAEVSVWEYLKSIEYGDGTLLDFFKQEREKVASDVTVLYPLVASLSAGQRAGLKFITLVDLIMIAATDGDGYKDAEIDDMVDTSIYEDVDRDIYKNGGVALTNEALRKQAAEQVITESDKLSLLSEILLGVGGASVIAFGVTLGRKISEYRKYSAELDEVERKIVQHGRGISEAKAKGYMDNAEVYEGLKETEEANKETLMNSYKAKSSFTNKLMLGFGIVMVVLSSVALYFTYRDLVDYYNVDYTPIPCYMIDEKDITEYNAKGEKIVIKNQSAYYKVVECNRAKDDEWYDILDTSGDLNGTVGRQWLALYAEKNKNKVPIIADSLKAVIGSADVPADYTTGIHMFGSDAAYDLNNHQFVWNNKAKSVYVYFTVDNDASGALFGKANSAGAAGSVTTSGYIVLAGVAGLALGVIGTLCITALTKKKKKAKAFTNDEK